MTTTGISRHGPVPQGRTTPHLRRIGLESPSGVLTTFLPWILLLKTIRMGLAWWSSV